MNLSKEQKKKTIFMIMATIITIIVIITLLQGTKINNASNKIVVTQTNEERLMDVCQEKITTDFQLIEPEFVWNADNNIDSNSLKGHVIYQDTSDVINTTDFECVIGNNGNDVWINWDRVNNPSSDDIIYDDRN